MSIARWMCRAIPAALSSRLSLHSFREAGAWTQLGVFAKTPPLARPVQPMKSIGYDVYSGGVHSTHQTNRTLTGRTHHIALNLGKYHRTPGATVPTRHPPNRFDGTEAPLSYESAQSIRALRFLGELSPHPADPYPPGTPRIPLMVPNAPLTYEFAQSNCALRHNQSRDLVDGHRRRGRVSNAMTVPAKRAEVFKAGTPHAFGDRV